MQLRNVSKKSETLMLMMKILASPLFSPFSEKMYLIYSTSKTSRYVFNQGPKKGLTDARSAVGFCLGSGLFGSYNSD